LGGNLLKPPHPDYVTAVLALFKGSLRLSRYSASVYCAHLLFVDLLSATPLFLGNPLWEVTRLVQ